MLGHSQPQVITTRYQGVAVTGIVAMEFLQALLDKNGGTWSKAIRSNKEAVKAVRSSPCSLALCEWFDQHTDKSDDFLWTAMKHHYVALGCHKSDNIGGVTRWNKGTILKLLQCPYDKEVSSCCPSSFMSTSVKRIPIQPWRTNSEVGSSCQSHDAIIIDTCEQASTLARFPPFLTDMGVIQAVVAMSCEVQIRPEDGENKTLKLLQVAIDDRRVIIFDCGRLQPTYVFEILRLYL